MLLPYLMGFVTGICVSFIGTQFMFSYIARKKAQAFMQILEKHDASLLGQFQSRPHEKVEA
jgi:hypothetical protein